MSKGSVKKTARSSAVDQFIYDLRCGKVGSKPEEKSQAEAKMLKNGPQTHSYPVKKKVEKFIDYDHLAPPKLYPNEVKLGIKEGEERFPADAKVPNIKKYDAKGNYIKHKRPTVKDNEPNMSTNEVVRKHLLSNPEARKSSKKPKTVA